MTGINLMAGTFRRTILALVHHCAYDPLFYNEHMVKSLKFFTLIRDPYQNNHAYSLDINKAIHQELKDFL